LKLSFKPFQIRKWGVWKAGSAESLSIDPAGKILLIGACGGDQTGGFCRGLHTALLTADLSLLLSPPDDVLQRAMEATGLKFQGTSIQNPANIPRLLKTAR
jgi:hypothetical protein